jgi:serine/threonine protein kinase
MAYFTPGQLLKKGQYEIIDTLGQGGFGITYLAQDHKLIPHSAGNLRQKIILVGRCTKELQNQFLSICEFNGRFNPIYKN